MPVISEWALQRAFTLWFKGERWAAGALKGQWKIVPAQLPGVVAWHTPNGGNRSAAEGVRFKQIGVEAGIPDYFFLWGSLFFIEFKEPGGRGSLQPSQKAMIPRLEAARAVGCVVDSLDDAKATVRKWGLTISGY